MPELPNVVAWAIPGFIACLGIELWWGRRKGGVRYEAKDSAASLTMGLGNFVIGLGLAGAIASVFFYVHSFALFDIGYTWWAFVLCFFFEDLAYYVFHRVSHERRWFWASHVTHHSSRHYNLSTALRQTWTSKLTFTSIFWLPLVLLGFPPPLVFFFGGVSLVYQFWIHTEAIDRLGPLEWILNTPSHHRVHHAVNPRYLDANYAGVLIVWDRLFGSFVAEQKSDPPVYGIVKPLESYHPLQIAFHEWIAIARDLRRARSGGEVFGFLLGPPGWSPDGSRRTSEMIKAEWRASKGSGASAAGTAHA